MSTHIHGEVIPPPSTSVDSSAASAAPRIAEGARREAEVLKRRIIWCAPPTVAVLAISMIPALQFTGWQWVVAVLSLPVVTWGAWPFHRSAGKAARHGSTTMDTLVSLGVVASSLWSWWALLFGGAGMLGMRMQMSLLPRTASGYAEIYFEGACTIVLFLLIGRWAEARTRYRAGDALRSLLELGAKNATRVHVADDGTRHEELIDATELRVGDLILVHPGETVATDGRIEEGSSALDTSVLTGESVPVDVGPADEVTGATLNTWGSLLIRATRVGEETTLSRIGRMVREAQAGKAPVQRLADRISAVFVPIVIAIALLTLVGWLVTGGSAQAAVTAAVAVLVVACPCALGLATPTALLVGSGRASQLGIVIRSAQTLEQTRTIDTMVLDKTGTVTSGHMQLESVEVTKDDSDGADSSATAISEPDAALLAVAAGVESASEHPVARAIVAGAQDRGVTPHVVSDFTNHAGVGVSALVANDRGGTDLVLVGRPSWLAEHGVAIPSDLGATAGRAEASGASAVALAVVADWRDHHEAGSEPRADLDHDIDQGLDFDFDRTRGLPATDPGLVHVDMDVQGMTCASCVNRVERKLQKLPGVTASVNLATESAAITVDGDWTDAQLEEAVTNAGYHGTVLHRWEDGGAAASNPTATTTSTLTTEAPSSGESTPDTARAGRRVLPDRLEGAEASAVLVVRDTVKPTSAAAIAHIRALGIEPILLTGDNEAAARHVAEEIGLDRVIAEVLPDRKREVVAQLQKEGSVVAMVGDGVNDAAALAQAGAQGLGIAMGSGTDVAIEAADITLVTSDLDSAATAIRISRRTLRIIKQNLFWAFAYNVAMIPLAIAGLLNPMLAAAAMAFSSVFVVVNSLRLRTAG